MYDSYQRRFVSAFFAVAFAFGGGGEGELGADSDPADGRGEYNPAGAGGTDDRASEFYLHPAMKTNAPIGVTVISPAFAKVGAEAVRRFRKYTGMKVQVIQCADATGFTTKLELDRLCGRRPVVFFDADLWLVRETDAFSYPVDRITAVHDPMVFHSGDTAFPARDCETFGMQKLDYFNSGLLLADFSRREHRALFQKARALHARGRLKPADTTDQFWLNYARWHLDLPWQRLPFGFNFWMRAVEWGCAFIPQPVTAVHAAGVPRRGKLTHLLAAARIFGGDWHGPQDELLRFDHAYRTQLR